MVDRTMQAGVYFLRVLQSMGYSKESSWERLEGTWRRLAKRNALNWQEIMNSAERYGQ